MHVSNILISVIRACFEFRYSDLGFLSAIRLITELFLDFLPDLLDGDSFDTVLGIGAFDLRAPTKRFVGDHALGPAVGGDPGRVGPTVHHNQRRT